MRRSSAPETPDLRLDRARPHERRVRPPRHVHRQRLRADITQYGQVVESDIPITEILEQFADPQTRDEYLRTPLFQLWNRMTGPLDSKSVLSPAPAIPLGGHWSVETLSVMTLPVYLSFTGQLFAPGAGMPAEVRRL